MRKINFLNFKNHPYYSKYFKKLKESDIEFCINILEQTNNLNKNDYSFKIVRLWLDQKNKPKNWTIIEELLIASI